MSAHETGKNGLTVIFYFYSQSTWTKEKVILFWGEEVCLSIKRERLQTVFDVMLQLMLTEQRLTVNGKELPKDGYLFWKTQEKEALLLTFVAGKGRWLSCGRLPLEEGHTVNLGAAYQNEVFYHCFSFGKDRQVKISRSEEGIRLTHTGGKEVLSGIYINKRAALETEFLKKGDRVELFGLTVFIFSEFLICSASYGNMRVAEGKKELPAWKPERKVLPRLTTEQETGNYVYLPAEERKLHREEIELELPEAEKEAGAIPFFLIAGQALTMLLPMLFMAFWSSRFMKQEGSGYYQISVIMAASSALFTVLWGAVQGNYQKKVSRRERKRKREFYREYLQKLEGYMTECMQENREILEKKYPCQDLLLKEKGGVGICRNQAAGEQHFIRLGVGEIDNDVKLHLTGKKRELNQDILVEEAFVLAERFKRIERVPVGICLGKIRRAGFTGENIYPVLLQALLQLAAHENGERFKIVFFYREKNEKEQEIAACIKWLPQLWREDKQVRFLAGNEKEAGEILPALTEELKRRRESKEAEAYYLFLIANEELVRGEGLYRLLGRSGENEGICTVFVNPKRERLPNDCECLVVKEKEKEELLFYEKGGLKQYKIQLEECGALQAEKYMRNIAKAADKEKRTGGREVERISFLGLFSCRNTKELGCLQRWQENRTRDRIRVPVGMGKEGRLVYLDIHEKFHGPHGIVAGTTGSGKSELLQTYLLSLSVSFSPEDVNFFIIDYKGGGMGNSLKELPHCAGVVSNLSGRQIKRALCAIKSENVRRQRMFAEAGVSHVEDYGELYRRGKVKQPVPHLILVVDEFAELKKEEPEFMQEIISVAQVGRSLGVHLILATQKPSGTVDDKIWSNTRFRLCLRVADRQDSNEMLHKPEAAYLTKAGQCYLQVGNDEIFELFQSGYCKAPYTPEKSEREEALLVSDTGKRMGEINKVQEGKENQLEAVSRYINHLTEQTAYQRAVNLWLPELPDLLTLEETEKREREQEKGNTAIRLCTGLCDDPERQAQYPVYYEPEEQGNLCLCGAQASGKSTFVQTLLWQLCTCYTPKQARFLLAASLNNGVNCFEEMPHCLGNLKTEKDAECFFFQLEALFEKRKKYERGKEESCSCLFLIIDGYGNFRRLTQERYEAFLEKLAGEGARYGIYLVLTALGTGSGELPSAMLEKLKVTMCLEMSDAYQYGEILRQYSMAVMPMAGKKGRGLCRVKEKAVEFQTPLLSANTDEYERIKAIKEQETKQKKLYGERYERFRTIPEKPGYLPMYEKFFSQKGETEKTKIPLGYEIRSGRIVSLSLQKPLVFSISGEEGSGKKNLLYCLVYGLLAAGRKVAVVDENGIFADKIQGKQVCFLKRKQEWESRQWGEKYCLCICSPVLFAGWYEEEKKKEACRENGKSCDRAVEPDKIVLISKGEETKLIGTALWEELEQKQKGIHLGGDAGNQRLLSFRDLSYGQMNRWEGAGIGYLKAGPGSGTVRVQIPLYGKEKKEDDFSGYSGTCVG